MRGETAQRVSTTACSPYLDRHPFIKASGRWWWPDKSCNLTSICAVYNKHVLPARPSVRQFGRSLHHPDYMRPSVVGERGSCRPPRARKHVAFRWWNEARAIMSQLAGWRPKHLVSQTYGFAKGIGQKQFDNAFYARGYVDRERVSASSYLKYWHVAN